MVFLNPNQEDPTCTPCLGASTVEITEDVGQIIAKLTVNLGGEFPGGVTTAVMTFKLDNEDDAQELDPPFDAWEPEATLNYVFELPTALISDLEDAPKLFAELTVETANGEVSQSWGPNE